MNDFIALGIICLLAGAFAYSVAPGHWQTPMGFAIIVIGFVPAGLVALVLLSNPAVLIPAALVMGFLFAQRRSP